MSRFRLLTGVATAVVLLLVGGLLMTHHGKDDARGAASGNAGGKSDPSAGSTKGGSASTEIAPVQTVPEGLPSSGAPSGLPHLAKQRAAGPLVKAPLPKAASKQGALVRGYPERIVPVAPRSSVRSSSVSPGVRSVQVALDAKVSAAADDVLRFYTLRLAKWGFAGSTAPAVGGSSAISFKRGKDSLVVTVTPAKKKSCRYTVFGTLHSDTHGATHSAKS